MKQLKVEESNMAFYGSEDHKKVRTMAAKTEVSWKGAGELKSDDGRCKIWIWRVENNQGGKCPFGIRKWPEKEYGKFFSGDSYIMLKTYKKGKSKKLRHDIYFWLGTFSSIDEKGVAAYKTVELDDLLGGAAKQHRLVQGHESETFLRCFKCPLVIMKGGVDSGFKHVEINAGKTGAGGKQPILKEVKKTGRRYRITAVDVATSSLNEDNVFLLDCGNRLYQYSGEKSSGFERNRAQQEVQKLKKKRHKTSAIVVKCIHVHRGDKSKFWKILSEGDSDAIVAEKETATKESVSAPPKVPVSEDADEDDEDEELIMMDEEEDGAKMSVLHGAEFGGFTAADVQILKITQDKDGMPVFTKELEGDFGDFSLDVLQSDSMYVVDSAMKDGDTVWLWAGSKADKTVKTEAMLMIESYLSKSPFPNCPVTMVKEQHDDLPLDFLRVFDDQGGSHDNSSTYGDAM